MKPYSLDFRKRLFSYSLTHTIRETAAIFQVSPNTVQLLRHLFCETGQLAPRPRGAARPRVISPAGELFLQVLLREEVDLTLAELRERYAQAYGVSMSLSTLHDTLRRLGITRKKSPPTILTGTPPPSRPQPNTITARSMPSPWPIVSTSMKPGPV